MIRIILPPKDRKRDHATYDDTKRRPGRPRKHFPPTVAIPITSVTLKEKPVTSQKHKRQRTKQTPKLSLLERLPVELLQCIFLNSMNVALPRASARLANMLSSEHLHLAMSLRILFLRKEDTSKRDKSQLLTCRFFTLDFLIRFIQYAHKQWFRTSPNKKYKKGDEEPSAEEAMRLLRLGANLRRPYMQGLNGLDMPEKLLHGPWTGEKCAFLRIMLGNDCGIDGKTSTAGEVAEKGALEAIRANALEAVSCLVGLDGVWVANQEMLRCAVLEGGCNQRIVSTLLSAQASPKHAKLDFLDPELWAWIDEQHEDSENAKWLTEILQGKGRWLSGMESLSSYR